MVTALPRSGLGFIEISATQTKLKLNYRQKVAKKPKRNFKAYSIFPIDKN